MSETIINNMARGWNRPPAGAVESNNKLSVSAALWSHDSDDVQEVWADPDPDRHIISVMQTSGYHAIVHKDEKHVFSRDLQKDGVQLMQAGVRPRAVHRGRWKILHLYVPAAALNSLTIEENLTSSPDALELIDPQCGLDPVIARVGCEVIAEMREQAPLSKLRIDLLGQDLAIHMIRKWSNLSGKPQATRSGPSALTAWQLKQAKDLIISGLGEDRALAEIAAAARLSPFHFARAFKASTGLPPHRYLILQRLERARDLLETTNLPISEIAAQVGYDDPGYLARLFRAHFGTTPANYRRERRS